MSPDRTILFEGHIDKNNFLRIVFIDIPSVEETFKDNGFTLYNDTGTVVANANTVMLFKSR